MVYNHPQKKVLSPSHLDQSLLKVLSRLNLNKPFKSLYETVFNRILLIRWDTLYIYTITQNIIGYGYRLFL